MSFGKILKELREEKGLTHKELGQLTKLGKSSFGAWEREEAQPTAIAIITLSKFFNVSADYLLGLEDDGGKKINTATKKVAKQEKSPKQERLLEAFYALPENIQFQVIGYAEGLVEKSPRQ